MFIPLRPLALIALAATTGACASVAGSQQQASMAVQSSIASVRGDGFPNLAAVPPPPANLPDDRAWARFEASLRRTGTALERAPLAGVPAPEASSVQWASQARAALDASPLAAPAPASSPDDIAWAVRERARMEADLARLPAVSLSPR